MVVAETIASMGAVKTAFDMAKALQNIHDATARDRAVIDLQKEILAAQAAQFALVQKVSDLETKVASFETWNEEKQRYELKELHRGFFAYILKENEQHAEAPHAICTNCYNRGFKSVLHLHDPRDARDRTWDCPLCNTKIRCQQSSIGELIANVRAKEPAAQRPATSVKAPGESCPSCGDANLRVEKSVLHPDMGDMGVRIHHMKCGSCGFTDQRTVTS